ncbi:MAG: diaminopimelate decarboxylase [Candidatus Marinimicrobia bacterium]|nr:diaminopimelate decarboxylase [Candidatus Neomarinimicrobiota bacterium]
MKINNVAVNKIAEKYGTPTYVYDLNKIETNVNHFRKAFQHDTIKTEIFFAMKANCHPAILDIVAKNGLGMDCVSPGELQLALNTGLPKDKILYTANYESEAELKFALESGVIINLDDISSFHRLIRTGVPEFISFRINPGKGRGKYEQITTGGVKAKFGVPFEKAIEAYQTAKEAGVKRFGAHMMTGSGTLDNEHFPMMLDLLLSHLGKVSEKLGIEFEFIDMGGGFGIPYGKDEAPMNLQLIAKNCYKILEERSREFHLGNPSLSMEPGRIFVGDAGWLMTRVNGIKESYKKFIGVDAGFHTLIRPALYAAKHTFIVDGKEELPLKDIVSICGQICENTDILAHDIPFPAVAEKDLIIIENAGAYGNVMSMPYNMRMRPAEVGIYNGEVKLITRRETIDDYFRRIQ